MSCLCAGQAALGDYRSTSALGLGDGITSHTPKWMQQGRGVRRKKDGIRPTSHSSFLCVIDLSRHQQPNTQSLTQTHKTQFVVSSDMNFYYLYWNKLAAGTRNKPIGIYSSI